MNVQHQTHETKGGRPDEKEGRAKRKRQIEKKGGGGERECNL